GKENGLLILQSIDQGPFKLGTTRNTLGNTPEGGVLLGPERPRTYEDLSDTKKKRYDADVHATNIVLQGLPKDIYKLINHNIEAKSIWDNIKMLLAGSELTKEDRESQLYDEFERFNSRFVTAVKLNKGLKETNHEQLYAYLKQHEKHAAQDRLIIKRITPATNEQLAFVSTVQPHAQSSHNVQGRQNQNQNQRYFARGNGAAGNGGAQNRVGNANTGQRKLDKMLLMQAQENGVALDEEELLFLAGEQDNTFDECDAFDSDVDDEPTAQSIFMANLSSTIPVQAKKAQPALYDGEELLKTHHVPVIVPSPEEDLEVQKSLVTEVRAMKAVYENLEAEVDQNEIDLMSGEIERKNLLITNENLIVECLSKDVFYTATDSVLNVVNGASSASRSKPRSNTKKDRTLPAKSALKQVEAHSRMNKSNEKQKNRVDSSISCKRTPWRALATIINLCLTGKTSGFERPRAPVLQILWGVVNEANIDYAERIWEEFTQCIHSFIKDKMNMALHAEGKKKGKHKFHKRPGSLLHLPTEESALGYLKFSFKNTKRVRFGMAIPDTLISEEIRTAAYYSEYVAKEPKSQSSKTAPVAKPAASKTSKSSASQPSKPTPAPTKPQKKKRKLVEDTTEAPSQAKRSKAGKVLKKRTLSSTPQLVDKFVDKGVPDKEPMHGNEEVDTQRAIEESLKEAQGAHRGPLPPVVFREPDTGKIQPLPDVEGKGKEKVDEEQAAQVLLNLQTPKKKNPAEQFIFQRCTPTTTEPSGLIESSSLYAELGLTDSETDSDEEASPDINAQGQEEGQGGTNPGDAGVSQTPSRLSKVQENLKLPTKGDVRLKEPASSAGTLSSMKNLNKEFLVEKSQEDELEKTNTEVEVQSMVTVPIPLQDPSVPVNDHWSHDWSAGPEYSRSGRCKSSPGGKARQAREHDPPIGDSRLRQEESTRKAFEALQKSIIRDESEQFDADKAEERTKKKSKQDSPKTPPGSPPLPHPPPPPSGASGASGPTGTSDSAQDPPPPPPSLTTNQGDQSHSSAAPGSSKTAASTAYTAWTMTTSRLKPAASSVPEDVLMHEESDFEAQDMGSDDEDSGSRHIPKVSLNQEWFKPLSEEERPATPEPAWSIPSSSLPVPNNNWASAIASSFVSPPENSLLSQTGDIGVFIDWFCKKQGITELTPEHLEGPAYEVVKAFHPDVIHLQFQMEECHKLLTNQVDEGLLRYNVSRPLPLGGPPDKAAIYPMLGQEQDGYPDQMNHMRILSVVRIEVFSLYGYDYMKKIVLRRADNQEYTIAESDFKDLYPSDFEDLYLLNLQGHLNHLPPKDKKILSTAVNLWIRNLEATGLEFMHDYKILDSPRAVVFRDKYGIQMIMRFNEIHKFSDGALQQIDEALDYRVKEFKVNKVNPGLNTRFWTTNDVIKSKQFMFAIQKRLKLRRIFQNLESFVGGRIREGDYRLLQRTE
ncbi:hypothetical protein Tco_0775747, partial [Tanacetum coccineum]